MGIISENQINDRAGKYKVCPECRKKNDVFEAFCRYCRCDMLDVTAEDGFFVIESDNPLKKLRNVKMPVPGSPARIVAEWDSSIVFELKDGISIGRVGEINIGQWDTASAISRLHATFTKRGAQWFVRDEKSLNRTSVNGIRLPPNEEKALYDGYSIQFGITSPKPMSFTFKN